MDTARLSTVVLFQLVAMGCFTSLAQSTDDVLHPIAKKSQLLFREDWKEIPAALPITQDHVATKHLVLGLHGPGKQGIKKSHHVEVLNDPFYVWSGICDAKWAVSLKPKFYRMILSGDDARVRMRTMQSGAHKLRLLIKLSKAGWYVSYKSLPTTLQWKVFELRLSDLSWKRIDIDTVTVEELAQSPSLAQVEEIGFTDLRAGNGSGECSRIDWIEVWGGRVNSKISSSRPETNPDF